MNYWVFFVLLCFPFSIGAVELSQVGPFVKTVLTDTGTMNSDGDFFRVVLFNSEADACIQIQRVNMRIPNPSKVLEIRKFCTFIKGSQNFSLNPDKYQDSEITGLEWKKHVLNFKMSYVGVGQTAPRWELQCMIEPEKAGKEFHCN